MEGRPALEEHPLPGPGSALGDALRGPSPASLPLAETSAVRPGLYRKEAGD